VNPRIYLLPLVVALVLAACSDRSNVAKTSKSATPSTASAPPAAATTYRASLEEGIAFAKPGFPEFVARTEGISQTEAFGRWTDGSRAIIAFKDPLPRKFDLVIKGAAYGPNVDQPVKVTIGPVTQEIVFNSDMSKDAQTKRLSVSLDQQADQIEFLIPQPTQPANGDVRKLGIALIELKIEPAAK
jgi:hypothetical protein